MKISVITVCFQAAGDLKATAKSVLKQMEADFEYVIVDGGSTDGTEELVKHWADDRILFVSEKDNGIYDAMNKGVRLCHGEYVIFMNAGDVFAASNVLKQVEEKLFDCNADILYGDYYDVIDEKTQYVSYEKVKANSWYFLMSKMICHQVIFARRSLLADHPFDLKYRYAADRKWLIQCVKDKVKLVHVPVAIAIYDREGISSDKANFEKVRNEVDMCLSEEYPIRAELLRFVKKNSVLRESIRRKIFKK